MDKLEGRYKYSRCLFPIVAVAATFLVYRAVFGASVTHLTPSQLEAGFTSAPLRFTKSGTFQITVFQDLHYGEDEWQDWAIRQDKQTTGVVNTVLDVESPQLVVLNGDLITGQNTYRENATHYMDQVVQPILSRNLPWASAYGNHDQDFNLSTVDLLAREKRWSNSLTQRMVPGDRDEVGVTNYYLPVYPSIGPTTKPALILWFFDSRSGKVVGKTGAATQREDWVSPTVVAWFTETRDALNTQHGGPIPSIAFFHIPTYSMFAYQEDGLSPTKQPGINEDMVSHQNDPPYTGQDIPFMRALAGTEELIATFSGHDHGADWCFKWDGKLRGVNISAGGLVQCFGRHTGYGGNGTWTRGSRQIEVDEKTVGSSMLKTWNRLEDRSVVGSVVLNATFGQDDYPIVPHTYSD